jgi:hypothetical protein
MKKIKTVKALALELCKREGKKKQVDIAQMSEIVGHLSDIFYEEYLSNIEKPRGQAFSELLHVALSNGQKRAYKKQLKS